MGTIGEDVCAECARAFQDLLQLSPGNESTISHQADLDTVANLANSEYPCKVCHFLFQDEGLEGVFEDLKARNEDEDEDGEACKVSFTFRPNWRMLDENVAPVEYGFDDMLVHLEDEDGEQVAWLSSVHLLLLRGEAATILGCEQADREDLELAVRWIRSCSEIHDDCPSIRDRLLPTRIIDVRGAASEDVKLVESASAMGKYIALSHCWGPNKPAVITTRSNLLNHLKLIQLQSLPQNFQDAVTVTRALGYEYLWIDSLCIVQDDEADWERECIRMASVYANAVLTIAAAKAETSAAGFLGTRSSEIKQACTFKVKINSGHPDVHIRILREVRDTRYEFQHDALTTRAWVMQERLLTPRILHFSKYRMVFECGHSQAHENYRYPIIPEETKLIAAKSFLKVQDTDMLQERWYDIIESYTWKFITFGKDRFPALSGIAAQVKQTLGAEYAAGLWLEDIKGLAWVSQNNLAKWRYVRNNRDESAPSWSWASCNTPVNFAWRNLWLAQGPWRTDMGLVSVDIVPKGQDPFGQILSGKLSLSGHTQTSIIPSREERLEEHMRRRNGSFRNSTEEEFAQLGLLMPGAFGPFMCLPTSDTASDLAGLRCATAFYPDDLELWQNETQSEVTWLLLGTLDNLESTAIGGWVGLALQQMPDDSQSFKRVGIVMNFSGLPGEGYEDVVPAEQSLRWMRAGKRDTVIVV